MLKSNTSTLLTVLALTAGIGHIPNQAPVGYKRPWNYSPKDLRSGKRSKSKRAPQAGDKLARKAAEGQLGIRKGW